AKLGRTFKPQERRLRVRGPALALRQHDCEIVLRQPVSLMCGELVPARPCGEILRHAVTGACENAELKLRDGMTGASRLLEPARRNGGIARRELPVEMRCAERDLRLSGPGIRGAAIPCERIALSDAQAI